MVSAKMITALFIIFIINPVISQVLNPPLFNLAENKKIKATATCGEINERPIREMYCFLAGATGYNPFAGLYSYSSDNDFAELRIGGTSERNEQNHVVEGGQNCEFCDSSVPDLSHPPEYMVDGSPRWWQSPPLSRGMEYNQINITIDLEQEFHVAYVSILMANSPRPGLWVLERSTDYGSTYQPWQYFAENPSQCEEFFGPDALQPILDDDSVICSTEYSQIVPLENGEIIVTLLNNRPSRSNFSHSERLQKFSQATNVRIRLMRTKTLQGHLMDLNDKKDPTITRRYFYAIKEIEMGGRCVCNGHAKTCDILDQRRSDRLLCRCEHNTCGDQCEKCCPGFEQKQWQPTREGQIFECEPCNCYGHSEECYYNKTIDEQHLSVDIKGEHFGGGVCKNCRDNTDGTNCNKCAFGYFRPYDKELDAIDVCSPCKCSPHYHSGACADGNGQCECRKNFEPPDCRACAKGYYDYPSCIPCECNVNGTSNDVCLPENGACPCKANYAGMFCDQCIDGTYQFPDCLECNCEERGASNKNCSKGDGQCQCKLNYGGKSCEVCADGYFNHPLCSYCNCDQSGTEKDICDKSNGTCLCKPGYSGERCDQCSATFYGYPDCKLCDCDLTGSLTESCNPSSGQCQCRANFTGRRCNKCSAGYYDYPKCSSCECDRSGSSGITCRDGGMCYCKPNFVGAKCDKCKPNHYNYPICEECNCDPRGVSHLFLGCDKVPKGDLCTCKERVTGRICNECKSTFWNLQYFNPLGCEDCGCYLPGTLSGLSDCDDQSGQCECKAHVGGRNCTICKDGFFNLEQHNQFGCQPCSCDIGGSYSAICDSKSGQCRCKPRINGRNCTGPIEMHYFPTLMHLQYEAEDGRTPDYQPVRFAIDKELFANFSWRGFAVFSPIQEEILLDIDIMKPSLYRLVFRYINPTQNDITSTVDFVPTYTHSQEDVKQTLEFKIPHSSDPKTFVVSKNAAPYPFVLNPGRWTLHIKTKQRLYLDFVSLFPAAYFEGSVLRQDVRNPCLLDQAEGSSCKEFAYPKIHHTKTTVGGMFITDPDGSKKAVSTHTNDKVLSKHGQVALIEGGNTYGAELGFNKPGNYVIVIDYSNFKPDVFPVDVEIYTEGAIQRGSVSFHLCPYNEFCREVVSHDGQALSVPLNGNGATILIKPSAETSVALGGIVAIPFNEWDINYLLPKPRCIFRNGKCHGSDFLFPPGSLRFDVETHANQNLSISGEHLPFAVADPNLGAIALNKEQPSIDVTGKVSNPDLYVFLLHYYNPEFASVEVESVLQNDKIYEKPNVSLANAYVTLAFCPSVSGCRAIVKRKGDNAMTFQINERFAVSFFLRNNSNESAYIDYVIAVPLNNYGDDVMDPIAGERSTEFLNKCSHLLLESNPEKFDDYCKSRVFSLTADYNMGSFSCDCNGDGSTSFKCEQFGGQCSCKSHVIGRQCEMCEPGYFGFPDCKPCSCLRTQQCDAVTGQCFCPLHVEGQSCDKCKPYAYGYDPLIGCQECKCNSQGTAGGSIDCDELSGQCKCSEKIGGKQCDKCLSGNYGFPFCYQCNCELAGSAPDICDQNTAQCLCKENVAGQSCESCSPGTFHLEERNTKGCTECFCFGVTNQCQSSDFVKQSLSDMTGWMLSNIEHADVTETPSSVEYNPSSGTASPAVGKAIYFSAPQKYLGKRIFSYGGKLSYIISSVPVDANSYRSGGADVILKGHNETIEFLSVEQPGDPKEDFFISVDFLPEKWRKEGGGGLVSRALLMLVLNRVNAIYLKASYYDRIKSAKLLRVVLDSAVEEKNVIGSQALSVENCYCPPGYTGSSCEECADGFYRVTSQSGGSLLGSCVACKCNGHSIMCDKISGICSDCQHETVGEHCERCTVGYFGDSTRGYPDDCQLCACPLPTLSNNFATSCSVSDYGAVRSCECKGGYAGHQCEKCDVGFFGYPMRPGETCKPCFCNQNNNLTIPAACNPYTGECSLCERNTMGNACEICASWYFGDAVTAKNCQECSCNKCGSYHCDDVSGKCECKPNVEGDNCERCVANAFDFSSCNGCRMCNCGQASISQQCDAENGKCFCQPGAVGQYCDRCEQGYWKYNENGCTKCDCEADLSLGTVCDVRTGQCHCMDGATGPRCDQCIDGYLRVPELGCRYCDYCVHVLVADLDILQVSIGNAEKDLGGVSTVYLTNQRLSRINSSVIASNPSLAFLKQETANEKIAELKKNVESTKSGADEFLIKAKRSQGNGNKSEERAKQLESSAFELEKDINENLARIKNLVAALENMADRLGRDAITTIHREALLNEAEALLTNIKAVDLAELNSSVAGKVTAVADELQKIVEKNTKHLSQDSGVSKLREKIGKVSDKIKEHRANMADIDEKVANSQTLNRKTESSPFYSSAIDFDKEKRICDETLQNATNFNDKAVATAMEATDAYKTVADKLTLNSSIQKLRPNYEAVEQELPHLRTLRSNVDDKASKLESSAAAIAHQFSGVKSNAHRAVQAAKSYEDIAKSVNDAQAAVDNAAKAVNDAESNAAGIAQKASETRLAMMDLLRNISNIQGNTKNELTNVVNKSRNALKAINETIFSNRATVFKIDPQHFKTVHDDKPWVAILNDIKEIVANVNTLNKNIEETAEKLPAMLEKAKKSSNASTSNQESAKLAQILGKSFEASVPQAIGNFTKWNKTFQMTALKLGDVSMLMEDLRVKLAKARDLANRVKIGAHFHANSSLQLYNPDKFTRTSAYSLISLYFKTSNPDGLLLFIGNEMNTVRTQGVPTDDYMALEIENGKLKLTWDLGVQETSISSNRIVSDGIWHKATIERTGQIAVLTVETHDAEADRSEGFTPGSKSVLNLHQTVSKFYVGGVPDTARMPLPVRNRHYIGQIEEISFHGQRLGLWHFALNGQVNTYGARERTTLRRDITETGVRFNGEGYVEMSKGSWVPRKETNIMMTFKTFASNGLLFYVGKDRDFVAIEIRRGKVYIHYNLGSGTANITSTASYNDGIPHTIEFTRSGKSAQLTMDMNKDNVLETTAPGALGDLDVTDVYYVGGLKYPVPQSFVTTQSFYGCIDKVKLNGQIMVNLNDPISASFVEIGCPDKPIRLVSFEPTFGAVHFTPLSIGREIEISLKFKTNLKDALLLLVTDEKLINSFAVTLEAGTLVVNSVTNGQSQPSRMKMEYKNYADGAWHYVTATRSDNSMKLDVDDMFSETGELNAVGQFSDTEVTLYFGQVPHDKTLHPELSSRTYSFVGCIGDVTFSKKLLDFANATRTKTGVSLVGCPIADPAPSATVATGEFDDGSMNKILENATTLGVYRPTPSPLDSCAFDFGSGVGNAGANLMGTRFGLLPFSRLEFDKLPDTFDTKGEFSIQFRAVAANGVLFYATNEKRTDYISLYMKNGQLVFSFDSGSGPLSLTTKRRFLDYQWHTAVAWREGKNASVSVDGLVEVRGEASGMTFAVDTSRPFYVGGLPQELVPFSKKTLGGVSPVFGGCLRDFRLNNVELTEPAASHGVHQCKDLTEKGLFFGPDGGWAVIQDQYNVGSTFSFEMEMKPRVKDAILLSIAADGPKGDYLTLQMIDGNVKFIVDNGDGPQMVNLSLSQRNSVCDGHWHSVKVYKTKNLLTMSVDGVGKFFAIKQFKATEINTKNKLFLGGVPREHVNRGLETNEFFHGCIRDVVIGKKARRKKDADMESIQIFGGVSRNNCPVD